jgi:phosphoglucomutase
MIQSNNGFTPTPVVSHAILGYNRGRKEGLADGIVITPSHNPPSDGGFKYNAINGGPADTDVTGWIEARAKALLRDGNRDVRRMPYETARNAPSSHAHDFLTPYVKDLVNVIDLDCIRTAGIRIGVDPLGGAAVHYWEPIQALYGLDITVVNTRVDPTFAFMAVDHDGKIRMDCSSPYAMSNLVRLKDGFQVAFGNDPDADRHGIVTPSAGLLNPNHYLVVAIRYLLTHRAGWPAGAAVGKTLVSSSMIDRLVRHLGRSWPRYPWDSSGSQRGYSPARIVSAARRVPGPVSCAGTARSGRPTRTV